MTDPTRVMEWPLEVQPDNEECACIHCGRCGDCLIGGVEIRGTVPFDLQKLYREVTAHASRCTH